METNDSNTQNDNEFVDITKIVKNNNTKLGPNEKLPQKIYQVQSTLNSKKASLVYLGKHSEVPIKNILSFNHPKYPNMKCDMISYTITKEEINEEFNENENNKYLKLIGFMICVDDYIIASVDFVFQPSQIINSKIIRANIKKNIENIYDGTFKIVLFQKTNGVYKETVIKEYTEYCGREQSIYILTSILIENNIIEKYVRGEE